MAPRLDKETIDALVDRLIQNGALDPASANGFASDCYLAAGLTSKGERRPERVRLWRGKSQWTGNFVWFEREPKPGEFLMTDLTPGWFVPDGAE